MLYANREYIEALATGLSAQHKVNFKSGKKWTTNVKTKTIIYNEKDLIGLPISIVRGLILHELAHIFYTEDTTSKYRKLYPKVQEIYNAYEDARIERAFVNNNYGDYANGSFEIVNKYAISTTIDNVKGDFRKLDKVQQFLLLQYIEYTNCNYGFSYTGELFFSEEVRQRIKDVANNLGIYNIFAFLSQTRSTQRLIDIIDSKIIPYIEDWLKQSKQDTSQSQMQQCNFRPNNNSLKQIQQDVIESNKGTKLSAIGKMQEFHDIKLQENEIVALYQPQINTLAIRLLSILKENEAIRYQGANKRGKLISKNVYKGLTNDERIYSRRNNPDNPKYKISLLLDRSGSMSGKPMEHTFIGACILNGACKKLGFDIDIIGFADRIQKLDKLDDYYTAKIGGGTNDNDFWTTFEKEVKNDKANTQRIIFQITDGDIYREDSTNSIIEKIYQKANITIFGIGLGVPDEWLKKSFHSKSIIALPNAEQLPKTLISLMQRIIHR